MIQKNLIHFDSEQSYRSSKQNLKESSIAFVGETRKIVTHGEEFCFIGWSKLGVFLNFVDLGLPSGIKWADCNLGASAPERFGLYFAWGETVGYEDASSKRFEFADYKWCNGTRSTLTKYNHSKSYGVVDGLRTLERLDDAANVTNIKWRMPTSEEVTELLNNTTQNIINDYMGTGVKGVEFVSKTNGASVFFPCGGAIVSGTKMEQNEFGYYFTGTVSNTPYSAICLAFDTQGTVLKYELYRSYGANIRPVFL